MAIGRVSGSMLTSNLDRQGIDLQFTTNSNPLLYMNFSQFALGINTNAVTETVTINGNLSTASLVFNGYTISPKSGGNVVIGGNLIIQGNTFTLNTNNLSIADSIIDLHTTSDLSPLTFDDGKDIGIKFHYYKTTDSVAFLGWANDSGSLEYYAAGSEGPGNTFVGTNYGTIKGGEFLSVNSTPSTSTTTGALRLSGGAGIQGSLYAGNIVTAGSAVLGTATATNLSTANAQITGGSVSASTVQGTVATANVSLYDSVTLTSTNATYYPQFTDRATSGNSGTFFGTGITFNPGTNTLATTTFSGTFSGTASITSGSISGVTAAASTLVATNFSSGNAVITGGNVATNYLTATNFSTANAQITGGSVAPATIAGTIATANVSLYDSVTLTSTNATYYPQFTDRATSGNSGTFFGTGLTFNPSTNNLSTTTFTGTFSGTASITSGSISGATGAFSTLQATNFSSGNAQVTITAGSISGITTLSQSGDHTITSNTQATSTTTGALKLTGGMSIATGNLYIGGSGSNALIHTGHILPSANGSFNLGSATNWYGTFYGISTQAKYADLAENYLADANYEPGTVVIFGGDFEITESTVSHDSRVAGVISTNPAYLMNSTTIGLPVALTGRVPCKVVGPVSKGDMLVASGMPGVACKMDDRLYRPGCVIGKSLQDKPTDEVAVIEVVVGRF